MNRGEYHEIARLAGAALDGRLSEEEHARLQLLLRAGTDARRVYLEVADLHAALLRHPQPADAAASWLDETASEDAPGARSAIPRRWPRSAHLALAASIALCLGLAVFWWRDARRPPDAYVATLIQQREAVWHQAPRRMMEGVRLGAGVLELQAGQASLRFDDGARLLLDGPAHLRIQSARRVVLDRGVCVFRSEGEPDNFTLVTPRSQWLDMGTEYRVEVSPEGETVAVWEGGVARRDRAGKRELASVETGVARRFTPGKPSGVPVTLPPRPPRELPPDDSPPEAGLLAREGFDYGPADILTRRGANGGSGWARPWEAWFRTLDGDHIHGEMVVPGESLALSSEGIAPGDGRVVNPGAYFGIHRDLAAPIDLSKDGVWYASFLARFEKEASSAPETLLFILRPGKDGGDDTPGDQARRLQIAVQPRESRLTGRHADMAAGTRVRLETGRTFLLVAKFVGARRLPDQCFVQILGPEDRLGHLEPSVWNFTSPPFDSGEVFNRLTLHVATTGRISVDELRIASTWRAAVAPYLQPVQVARLPADAP